MANNDLKISQMPLVDNVEAGDIIPIVRDGENMAVDASNLQGGGIGDLGDPVVGIEVGDKIPLVRNGETLSLDGMAIGNLGQMAFDTATAVDEVKADVETLRTDMSNTVFDLGGRINEKQDAFTTSEDLQMADDVLSLTDMAKKRLFIDMWNTACGQYGKYDPDNAPNAEHPFYLNELWLTYSEAVVILTSPRIRGDYLSNNANSNQWIYADSAAKTVLPKAGVSRRAYCQYTFIGAQIEVVNAQIIPLDLCFSNCKKLRKLNILQMIGANSTECVRAYEGCTKLQDIYVQTAARFDVNLKDSPLITRESFSRIVTATPSSVAEAGGYTITVHADVYAKLTGDTTNEATAALTPEEAAQWQQVVTDAAEKNISFIEATT